KALLASSLSAISSSARFFSTEARGANWRAAIFACLPSRSASSVNFSFVAGMRFSQYDQIVAVNDLFVSFVAQNFFNPACMQSSDPIQLLGAVVDQTTGELFAVQVQATHTLPNTENTAHFLQTRWQKTLAFLYHGIVRALVDDNLAARFQIVSDPMLARSE